MRIQLAHLWFSSCEIKEPQRLISEGFLIAAAITCSFYLNSCPKDGSQFECNLMEILNFPAIISILLILCFVKILLTIIYYKLYTMDDKLFR